MWGTVQTTNTINISLFLCFFYKKRYWIQPVGSSTEKQTFKFSSFVWKGLLIIALYFDVMETVCHYLSKSYRVSRQVKGHGNTLSHVSNIDYWYISYYFSHHFHPLKLVLHLILNLKKCSNISYVLFCSWCWNSVILLMLIRFCVSIFTF